MHLFHKGFLKLFCIDKPKTGTREKAEMRIKKRREESEKKINTDVLREGVVCVYWVM